MISRMKSPVYKINSMTTSATSINKVANFGCIALEINHPPLKKKAEGGKALLHFVGISLFFIFSVPQNSIFTICVQLCIKKST